MASGATQPSRVADGLLRLAGTGAVGDLDFCWEAARRIRRLIPFEAWCWVPFDPATLLPAGPHVGDNPAFRERWIVPRLLAIEYDEGGDVNLHTALARSRRPVGGLGLATDGDLGRSRRWRELLGPSGLGDEFRVSLVAPGGQCWGCLTLYRERSSRPFSEGEAACLGAFAMPLGQALRHILLADPSPPRPRNPAADGRGILVLDPASGGRWAADSVAEHWLRGLSRPDGAGARGSLPPLPAAVHALIARLAAVERDGPAAHPPPRLRARTTDGTWLTLRASRLSSPGRSTPGEIAITLEPARAAELVPLILHARALTARERELIALVMKGAKTDAIARTLDISPNTVQDHLKAIFAKTGLRSRRELVARLLGTAHDSSVE